MRALGRDLKLGEVIFMAKLAPTSTKYIIRAKIKAKGVIEKPDVIGAIFGQTEGLLGSELDLRELQKTGRIGRIDVKIKSSEGNSEGEIIIPSSLDASETALIAATLETIERIGPCTAKIVLEIVEDTRADKRKYVVDKAQEILKGMMDSGGSESEDISEKVKESVRTHEITSYKGIPCGPTLLESEDIIVVEGRADIINLLKHGIKNTIAIGGTSVPKEIGGLSKEKIVTAFVDGDRGGKLIVKELLQVADVEFVATAPEGKEVEELSKKEIFKALRERVKVGEFDVGYRKTGGERYEKTETYKPRDRIERPRLGSHRGRFPRGRDQRTQRGRPMDRPPRRVSLKPKEKELFKKTLEDLVGTRAACILDQNNEVLGKVPVSELPNTLKTMDNAYAVVFDGKVDFKIADIARMVGVSFLVGMEKEDIRSSVNILSRRDL